MTVTDGQIVTADAAAAAQQVRPPCPMFAQHGFCSYGWDCEYQHGEMVDLGMDEKSQNNAQNSNK